MNNWLYEIYTQKLDQLGVNYNHVYVEPFPNTTTPTSFKVVLQFNNGDLVITFEFDRSTKPYTGKVTTISNQENIDFSVWLKVFNDIDTINKGLLSNITTRYNQVYP